MNRQHFINKVFTGTWMMFAMALAYAGTPLWTLTPLTATKITVPTNGVATVKYLVTNQSKRSHTLIMTAIPGITQVTKTGNCPNPFILGYQQSCILNLTVNGSAITRNIIGGPVVCQQGNLNQCYQPSSVNILHITQAPAQEYTIGGSISGLTASGLVLQNNGGDNLSVAANATTFQFSTPVAFGGSYNVTVLTQPKGLTCTVNNGSGSNVMANVTNIAITCSTITYTIGGSISGLTTSGLILQNNGGDNLSVAANATTFQFSTPVAFGGSYNVTVLTQPKGLICTVNNGSGSNVMADVTNVVITCREFFSYTVGAGNIISGSNINAITGSLTPLGGSPFATGLTTANSIVLSPDVQFLYEVGPTNNAVFGFSLDLTTGNLSSIGSFATGGPLPRGLAISPSGLFIFASHGSVSAGLSVYTVNTTTGALTSVVGSPYSLGGGVPRGVAVSRDNRFVYALNSSMNTVYAYSIDASTGALTSVPGSPFLTGGTTPQNIVVSPNNNFVYITNQNTDTVSAFSRNTITGALTPIVGSPFSAGDDANGIAITPNGNFLYVSNFGIGTVTAFSVNTITGALTSSVPGSPFTVGAASQGIAITPDGSFLYVASGNEASIYALSINSATGALTPIPGSPFAVGSGPVSIAIG
ncbi:beta-propeller fold lactonase family protein [Legionella anisa]|uniref:Uncharacterized protein n=1 Tax=Legionella anisa TaxID=28082 RepID=A0AAX0WZ39_9GAMM|nr:beta-propeller fold lactonase family protein [Legionella anisa]AWN73917.1 hypothetical protein DLD14_08760 [Legionella anisa]KTC67185.1 transmembrane protein [Legionella anisa]MBN5937688.1 beta-propeller fold lactonase family protein [Legionella anisa]MCW8426071.1 lactonase family protein [Legionella anisa]MCW8448492.1 lactonase family protein [Legionella anisa]